MGTVLLAVILALQPAPRPEWHPAIPPPMATLAPSQGAHAPRSPLPPVVGRLSGAPPPPMATQPVEIPFPYQTTPLRGAIRPEWFPAPPAERRP